MAAAVLIFVQKKSNNIKKYIYSKIVIFRREKTEYYKTRLRKKALFFRNVKIACFSVI